MTQEKLKEIYDLIAKYEKAKWTIKRSETVLKLNVTFIYNVDNFLLRSGVNIDCVEVKMTKEVAKYFEAIWDVYEINIEDSELSNQIYNDVFAEVEEEVSILEKFSMDERKYLKSIFYTTTGKLNPWKTVLKTYDFSKKYERVVIKLSSQYNAVIKKNEPVQVGCQNIPIDIVRQIVNVYDNLK